MPTIKVQSRITGNAKPDLDPVLLEILTERLTAAELIARTVTEQVSDLLSRHQQDADAAQQALARQYLTEADVAAQAARGSIRLPGKPPAQRVPHIDVQAEIDQALCAFTTGKFLIFTGGRQITRLEEELDFREQTTVMFLRVMPLAGG
jgi:hypothetical protein